MLAVLASLALLNTRVESVDPVHVPEVLAAKCGQCHGPGVARPKGHFGFVTDLKRFAEDPNYVVPDDPEGSYLWTQIEDGEMPPEKARAGPMTDEEKTTVIEWIKAGAPPAPDDPQFTSRGTEGAPSRAAEPPVPPPSLLTRALQFAGKLHILTIHFPIALLAAASLGEAWSAVARRHQPLPAVRFCLWLGALAAVTAAGLGWLHAYFMTEEPANLLMLHRWIGTGAGVLAPLVA